MFHHVDMRARRRLGGSAWILAAWMLVGCGDAPESHEKPDAGPTGCAPGELTREDGSCQPAGLPPDMACAPGELLQEDGSCQPAGVPPSACAPGFVPEAGGCSAILPANPCPAGQMATPGESACREVSPCGSGTWGDVPVEANTQFVDGAYQGGNSDGTAAQPWTTIQEGVNAAAPGAIVAVAAGSYAEDVRVQGKAVRLWGRCPAMVEVAGGGVADASIRVLGAAAGGAEVRDLAVTGALKGLRVAGAKGVAIDRVWVHDAGSWGVAIERSVELAEVVLTGSLIEGNREAGVFVVDAVATLDASVVRGSQPNAMGAFGWGLGVGGDATAGVRSNVTVRASVVEQNTEGGIVVLGSDATIEATVVQGTLPSAKGAFGRGITIQADGTTKERSNATIRASVVAQSHDAGVLVTGSDATIEATLVRDTRPGAKGAFGWGISASISATTKEPSNVTVRSCVVEQSHEAGVDVASSIATIEATVVRATQPNAAGAFGLCVVATSPVGTAPRSGLTIRSCVVEQSHGAGVFVEGSDATIEATVVRDTLPDAVDVAGRGISAQDDLDTMARANVAIRACLVEQSHGVGVIVLGTDATIEATVVRDTLPDAADKLGHGVQIGGAGERSEATVRACLIEENRHAGLLVSGSNATIEASIVRGTASDADGSFGDGISNKGGTVAIQGTLVTDNARAGVASFGGTVAVDDSHLFCNAFDVEGEPLDGAGFSFDGSKGWQCTAKGADDCNDLGACHVETAGLAPPPSLPPAAPLP